GVGIVPPVRVSLHKGASRNASRDGTHLIPIGMRSMPRDRKRVDVLVLGAGAAGLAAARDLSHAGLRVTVIEARPRVGGRILTLHDPRSPVPIELGAEFIHGEAAETLPLAQA